VKIVKYNGNTVTGWAPPVISRFINHYNPH
jgi:hypothetical protein